MKFKQGDEVFDPYSAIGKIGRSDHAAGWEVIYQNGTISWWDADSLTLIETKDNVNSPSHYQFPGGVEVIQITEHLNFCKGNAVKYLTRSGRKDIADEVEDLKKAIWYIQREIDRINAERTV